MKPEERWKAFRASLHPRFVVVDGDQEAFLEQLREAAEEALDEEHARIRHALILHGHTNALGAIGTVPPPPSPSLEARVAELEWRFGKPKATSPFMCVVDLFDEIQTRIAVLERWRKAP